MDFVRQHGYDNMPELTDEDRAIIHREHTSRWSHPLLLYLVGETPL